MKLPSRLLQVAYYTALNGNVSYGGSAVPVYDFVRPSAIYPFIVLGSQNVIESNYNTDKRITEVVFDVDVVTGFEAGGGKSQCYDISDTVIGLIRKTPGNYLSLSGFVMVTAVLESAVILQEQTETHILYINKLRFRHLIQET